MEIDWFTVIAQIVNFLILVWLLKRFLYKPILRAVDERESKIASQLEEAARIESEALQKKQLYIRKNEEFDRTHAAQLEESKKQVEAKKIRLYEEAREETNALRIKLEESLRQQEEELKETLKRKTKEEVFAIASKALSDLAGEELEEQVITVFINKMSKMGDVDKIKFIKALQETDGSIRVRTAFDLTGNLKKKLERVLQKMAPVDIQFQYELDPDVVGGIVVETSNFQLAWNIESYLESLKMESIIN